MSDDDKAQKPSFPWKLVIIIFIIILICVGIYYGSKSPVIKTQYQKVSTQFKNMFKVISNPMEEIESKYGWNAGTQVVETEKPKGVVISDFRSKSEKNYIGDIVRTSANVEIYGLEEENTAEGETAGKGITTNVNFKCSSSDGSEGSIFLSGVNGNRVEIKPEEEKSLSADCEFKELIEGSNKLKLSAEYENFNSRAGLKIYTLKKEEMDMLEGKDAFDAYNIKEPQLTSDNLIESTYTSGPLILTLSLNNKQPIDETGNYRLYVKLQKDSSWKGELEKLNSIQLIFPSNLDVINEKCDFGSDLILSENELAGIDLKERAKEYWCNFKVKGIRDRLSVSSVNMQINYDYIFEKEISVDVRLLEV